MAAVSIVAGVSDLAKTFVLSIPTTPNETIPNDSKEIAIPE